MLTATIGSKVNLCGHVHDFSVCLLYFFSLQNLIPLKVGHRSALAARNREGGARLPTAAGKRSHEITTRLSLIQQTAGFAKLQGR